MFLRIKDFEIQCKKCDSYSVEIEVEENKDREKALFITCQDCGNQKDFDLE